VVAPFALVVQQVHEPLGFAALLVTVGENVPVIAPAAGKMTGFVRLTTSAKGPATGDVAYPALQATALYVAD
jgi:hypothetical protein